MFTRRAGEGLDLEPDVVIYMGEAAQGKPQDQAMDVRIAEGMLNAMGRAIEPQLLDLLSQRSPETRTLEYIPERDGPPTIEPIGPYNPDTDEGKFETMEIRYKPKQMTPGEVRDFFGGMDPGLGLDLGPYGRQVADIKRRVDSGRTPGFGDMNEYGLPRDMSPEDQAEVMKRYPIGGFSK